MHLLRNIKLICSLQSTNKEKRLPGTQADEGHSFKIQVTQAQATTINLRSSPHVRMASNLGAVSPEPKLLCCLELKMRLHEMAIPGQEDLAHHGKES